MSDWRFGRARLGHLGLTALVLLAPAGARGQVASDVCRSAATDSLAAARRARSALVDRDHYERLGDARFHALVATDAAEGIDDDTVVQFHFIDQTTAVDGYRLCGAQGGPAAELIGGWTGLGLEARDTGGWWAVSASLVSGGDSLSPADFVADEMTLVSPDATGTGYVFWLLEAQVSEWVSVGYGGISDAEVRMSLGEDASGATASNSAYVLTDAPGRHVVRLGVPAFDLSTTLVVGEGLDFGAIAIGPLPVPGLPDLELGGEVARLGHEDLYVAGIEAGWALFDDRLRPTLELVSAWPDARLRTARLRVAGGVDIAGRFLDDMPTVLGWAHGGLGAYAEISRFDSAEMNAAGGGAATGFAAGIAGRIGVRAIEIELAGFAARDRVETLERLPDAGGRGETGLDLHLRIGW